MDFLLPLGIALTIGATLGLERELAHKPAGLRTQALITFGTTLFIIAVQSMRLEEIGRVAANVLTGLGFLGGGVILRERGNVRGLTTAALIWVNGALGIAVGMHKYMLAIIGALAALLTLRVLSVVERRMGKKCRVFQYEVIAEESEMRAVYEELSRSHFQDGPVMLNRQNEKTLLRFALCNPPSRHQRFAETLRRIPEVVELKIE
jgi:putative Mg2+ transporter-C (MgtC) family protein